MSFKPSVRLTAECFLGHKFDYHGQCDLLFTHAPNAAGGKGMDIHVRTKHQDFYSYINQVAIKIGSQVLEVGHETVRIDGLLQALPLDSGMTLSGFPVLYKKDVTANGRDQQVYRIILNNDEFVELKVFNLFISVKIHGATDDSFTDSTGILPFFGGLLVSLSA